MDSKIWIHIAIYFCSIASHYLQSVCTTLGSIQFEDTLSLQKPVSMDRVTPNKVEINRRILDNYVGFRRTVYYCKLELMFPFSQFIHHYLLIKDKCNFN